MGNAVTTVGHWTRWPQSYLGGDEGLLYRVPDLSETTLSALRGLMAWSNTDGYSDLEV